jgi:hypothetical protein
VSYSLRGAYLGASSLSLSVGWVNVNGVTATGSTSSDLGLVCVLRHLISGGVMKMLVVGLFTNSVFLLQTNVCLVWFAFVGVYWWGYVLHAAVVRRIIPII